MPLDDFGDAAVGQRCLYAPVLAFTRPLRVQIVDRPVRGGKQRSGNSRLLPVDDAEGELRVLGDPRSSASMQLLGHSGTAIACGGA